MYSKRGVNIISLILTIIIFCLINTIMQQKNWAFLEKIVDKQFKISEAKTEENERINLRENTKTEETEEIAEKIETWKIEIPEISLEANISEGTDKQTLDQFVGHFETTQKIEGNIGLAAHNRGYPVNYFAKLKDLKGGEEIIYTYGETKKTYVVTKNIKISDVDWSYLQNTAENKITLITCIANEPAYRRCVQAIEKEEN